jgi:hypothetical protein
MNKSFAFLFGGLIAYILLLLYACSVVYMTKKVIQHGIAVVPIGAPSEKEPLRFDPGIIYVVTTIGGLVSALVVSKLSITKPGEAPKFLHSSGKGVFRGKRLYAFLNVAYLVVWLVVGLVALVVGVLIFPKSNATLGEIGTTWLGLAVASGYAYFGLEPKS